MKRLFRIAIGVIAILMLILASAYSQEEMMFISNTVFDNPQRGSAVFVHDEHNEKAAIDDCAVCHHLYDDNGRQLEDESSEDQACGDCHSDIDEGSKPKLIKAYHLNCKNCHLKAKKGPILCAQCHVQ